MDLDKRASDILIDAYWSTTGWRREPVVAPEDFAYAKSRGVMFDPIRPSHDQVVHTALKAASEISQAEVSDAFVASLSSRRLDLRSGLGSYAVARHFREHRKSLSYDSRHCSYCGEYDHQNTTLDLNILNFERVKWGGVRHSHPAYVGFDLETLRKTQRPSPGPRDFMILKSIIDTAGSMSPSARLSDLDKALAKVLPSNSAERRALIGILGYAGIIIDSSRPAFRKQFVPFDEREHTSWSKDDWPYPVQWWTGSHGVQTAAVADWFPLL